MNKIPFKAGDRVILYDPESNAGERRERATVMYPEDGNDMYTVLVDADQREEGDDGWRDVSSDQMYHQED